jgi:hypothetical protein
MVVVAPTARATARAATLAAGLVAVSAVGACSGPEHASSPSTTTAPPPLVERANTQTVAPPPPTAGTCPGWAPLAQPGVSAPGLIETSGLAGGLRNPAVWWAHNDSGDSPRVFALEGDGRLLTTVTLSGATAWDWEDMDIGPGPGRLPTIYVADVGDNPRARHGTIGYQLYRFREPDLGHTVPSAMTLTAQRIDVVYSDARSHNVEATLLDPITGDYFIITKDVTSGVFRIPAAALAPATTVVAQKVGEIVLDDPATTHDRPVAADISADGSMIVVKTMELTWFWTRATGQTVMQALAASPCPPEALGSGEAIAFDASGGQIATLAEGRGKPLFRYRRS